MDTLPVVLQDLVYSYEHQLGWHKVVDQITEFYQKHKRCVDLYMVEHWREKFYEHPERNAPGGTLHKEFLCSWHWAHSIVRPIQTLPVVFTRSTTYSWSSWPG